MVKLNQTWSNTFQTCIIWYGSLYEYSAKFEEARLRCSEFHAEDQFSICTRFVNGLRFDIQRMVKLHAPHTVEDAYQKALKVEKINIPFSFAHIGKSMSSKGNTRPNNIRRQESCLCNSLPVASPIESKASNSLIVCHKCHHKGHIVSRCP